MKKINVILTLVLGILGLSLKAQQIDSGLPAKKLKHFIGAGAGFSTGYGPTYEMQISRFKLQATFTPFKTEKLTQHSIGLTPKIVFFKQGAFDIFAYQGNHYLHKIETETIKIDEWDFDAQEYKTRKETKNNSFLNNALGIGMTVGADSPFNWQLMGGFRSKNGFEEIGLTIETTLLISLNKEDWKFSKLGE